MDHWQIFDDDKQAIRFLTQIQEFSEFHINDKEEGCNYTDNDNKANLVPGGLVAQEKIFYRQNGHKHKEESNEKPYDHLEVNIGSDK
jgi:hypothetical protein